MPTIPVPTRNQGQAARVLVRPLAALLCAVTALAVGGCASIAHTPTTQPTAGLTAPCYVSAVDAVCVPPAGWSPEPLKSSSRHWHQLWISPSGATAYGVIRMSLPLPAGAAALLKYGVLPNMKAVEGKAELLFSEDDPTLPGVRFIAQSDLHLVRGNVLAHWFEGWMVYAGSKVDRPVNPAELDLAIRAREHTLRGHPAAAVAAAPAEK